MFLHTTRGIGDNQHIAIVDELAHTDNRIYTNVIVPTLATGSSFIGITTLGEESELNFVSELINLKNEQGENVMNVVDFKMACPKCIKAGTEASCTHKDSERPHFHDRSRQKDIEAILQNNQETYLREIK